MNPAAFPPPPPGPPTAHCRTLRPPRGRARLALLALVLLALGVGGYITTHGGWVNALRLPPVLDASTPRSQNGWTLEDIQLPGPFQRGEGLAASGFLYQGAEYRPQENSDHGDTADAFGLWLTPPPGEMTAGSPNDATGNPQQDPFFALAQLSTGETLPLIWHYISRTNWQQPLENADGYVFLSLPTGYSDSCRFVDITVSDRHNHAAHWHFSRLPRMRHAVPPPAKARETVTQNGITMTAKAWHEPGGLGNRNLGILLRPMLPPQSHQWEILVTRQEREWEPFGEVGYLRAYSESGTTVDGRNGVFTTGSEQWFGGGIYRFGPDDPYPLTTRFLRLSTELHQYETYDEPVVFHNLKVGRIAEPGRDSYYLKLPRPLSITTPSGVTVRLLVQDQIHPGEFGGGLNFRVTVQPRIKDKPTAYPLPNSPLSRTYGKPVRVNLMFPPPYEAGGWTYEQDGRPATYSMSLPPDPFSPSSVKQKGFRLHYTVPPVLKNFTIIVHQRVDIQTIPMTFTLPITDKSPPYYPKGFQIPKR